MGDGGVEVLVPSASDVVYKYTWLIKKFGPTSKKRGNPIFDSAPFELHVNGLRTRWNLSIRFWTGPDRKRVLSPVVMCLNLLRCWPDETPGPQATVKYQFGVYCRSTGRYEMSAMSRSVLALAATRHLISVGHQDVAILQKHLEMPAGDIRLVCKLQVVPTSCEDEIHTLSQDLSCLLTQEAEDLPWAKGDIVLRAGGGRIFSAHGCVLGARSQRLAVMLSHATSNKETGIKDEINGEDNSKEEKEDTIKVEVQPPADHRTVLELDDLTGDVLEEVLRYIYTGRVENLDGHASSLLAAACKYELQGLLSLCERSLVETLSGDSVAARLLLADECGCETLKRAALAYCEAHKMPKNVAWAVMEMVNPDLFQEACDAGLGESASSFGSSLSDAESSSR